MLSKVNRVCGLVREAIAVVDEAGLRLSTITSLVRQQPPATEEALRIVVGLGKLSLADEGQGSAAAEKALSYLILLVNVDNLFDVALGMYDLDIVRTVC